MNNFYFKITDEVLALGVKSFTAQIADVSLNVDPSEFEKFKIQELEKIKVSWKDKIIDDDEILKGFRELHQKVGRSKDYVSSPESLTRLLLTKDRFPKINILVDIYNLVSLKSRLALGAHDIEKVIGGVTLKLTDGTEGFVPLGKIELETIFPGEYGYVDEGNNVICRLEVLQCDPTKITLGAKNIFLIIQGIKYSTDEYVREIRQEVCDLIVKFCGGSYTFLN